MNDHQLLKLLNYSKHKLHCACHFNTSIALLIISTQIYWDNTLPSQHYLCTNYYSTFYINYNTINYFLLSYHKLHTTTDYYCTSVLIVIQPPCYLLLFGRLCQAFHQYLVVLIRLQNEWLWNQSVPTATQTKLICTTRVLLY